MSEVNDSDSMTLDEAIERAEILWQQLKEEGFKPENYYEEHS